MESGASFPFFQVKYAYERMQTPRWFILMSLLWAYRVLKGVQNVIGADASDKETTADN